MTQARRSYDQKRMAICAVDEETGGKKKKGVILQPKEQKKGKSNDRTKGGEEKDLNPNSALWKKKKEAHCRGKKIAPGFLGKGEGRKGSILTLAKTKGTTKKKKKRGGKRKAPPSCAFSCRKKAR